MPKVAYSEAERQRIRTALISVGLELMAKQGIQHTTVEQIYQAVGISRTFFYSFFPTKEDLVVETLYLQQPRILAYIRTLLSDPTLSWRQAVEQFLYACCYGGYPRRATAYFVKSSSVSFTTFWNVSEFGQMRPRSICSQI